ncbi:MAG: helix-turn-helix domain-containing protein [Gemmataceae bacterium]
MAGLRGDPAAELSEGRLLDTLYYRLSPLTLTVPPLRERLSELPRLIDVLARRLTQAGLPWHGVSDAALAILRLHAWPGAFHELSRVLIPTLRQSGPAAIEPDHLPLYLRSAASPPEQKLPLDQALETVERRMIETALRLAGGNKKKASDLLGIWRPRLLRRIEALGIQAPKDEDAP